MMPEGVKIPQSASPLARAGAGDSSAPRGSLHATPRRVHPAHPKKQLFSTPVNKFTAKRSAPSANIVRIRSCLDEYRANPARPAKIGPKAASMEDLTPTKRVKKNRRVHETHPKKVISKFRLTPSANLVRIHSCLEEYCTSPIRTKKICPEAVSVEEFTFNKDIKKNRKDTYLPVVRSPGLHIVAEEVAAARIGRFMLVTAWRRRRDEIRCLRKTLETQVTCSERLRIQVCVLKSLLDSDNAKVVLAMRELERLKQLLRDKDMEKALLEKEKHALEQDVCAAEDRASEMSIGWRNCRNELDGLRAASACCERALTLERAAHQEARAHCERAFDRLSSLEEELSLQEAQLAAARAQHAELRREHDDTLQQLNRAREQLEMERAARERCSRECAALSVRVALSAQETSALRGVVEGLRAQLARLERELSLTREQLDWWPRPLTKMLGAARSWLRHPMSIQEAVLWSFIPARHGC